MLKCYVCPSIKMCPFPGSPKLNKGAFVTISSHNSPLKALKFDYNPETISVKIESSFGNSEGKLTSMIRTNTPKKTISFEIVLDAIDLLEKPDEKSKTNAVENGIYPQLMSLEMLINPSTNSIIDNNNLANSGSLEIVPEIAPLTLLVWGINRIIPVKIGGIDITEEEFDPITLNPIRAKVSINLTVLSYNELDYNSEGYSILFNNHIRTEVLSQLNYTNSLSGTGVDKVV